MTKPRRLVAEIQQYCAAHANAAIATRYQRYFKEGYDAWGLLDKGNPFFTARRDEWLDRYRDIGTAGFVEAGERLFATGKFEEGAIAIQFLVARLAELDAAGALSLARWFESGVRNWAHTDVICGQILGPMLTDGRLPLDALAHWRQSPLRFQRRAAVVAAIDLLGRWKKGQPPSPDHRALTRRLLTYVEPMMHDEERVVHQGLGWFLREAWKRDAADVEPFLLRFKDSAPRLIFQYATERMSVADKARFKASKASTSPLLARSRRARLSTATHPRTSGPKRVRPSDGGRKTRSS